MSYQRTFPAGFIAPCFPTKADTPPSGGLWLHEIKHDGFRVIARKEGDRIRLYSRPGNDLTDRFPLIVESLARLRPRSCIIDGEAVCCDDKGDDVAHHSGMISPGGGCLCRPTQVRFFGFPKEGPDASRENDHAPSGSGGPP